MEALHLNNGMNDFRENTYSINRDYRRTTFIETREGHFGFICEQSVVFSAQKAYSSLVSCKFYIIQTAITYALVGCKLRLR
jgi:hypothetical protein